MGISSLFNFLCRATSGIGGRDKRPAKLCLPRTAIFDEEREKAPCAGEVHAIDDRAALFARGYEMRASKRGEMEGERVLRKLEPPRDVAGSHAVRSALHKQTEDLQPALLSQGAQRTDHGG